MDKSQELTNSANEEYQIETGSKDVVILELFNKAMVEPINHVRRELTEGDCLSYL